MNISKGITFLNLGVFPTSSWISRFRPSNALSEYFDFPPTNPHVPAVFLSVLCKKEFSGTQYALLSSVMGVARTFLSSPSGFIVESLGWSYFFVLSTIFGLPGLIILFWMKRRFPIKMQIP